MTDNNLVESAPIARPGPFDEVDIGSLCIGSRIVHFRHALAARSNDTHQLRRHDDRKSTYPELMRATTAVRTCSMIRTIGPNPLLS